MSVNFKYLFSPIKIGPVIVKNRIYMAGHGTNYSSNPPDEPWINLPSETDAYYLGERAKGGVGLIVYASTGVHISTEYPGAKLAIGYDERCIPGFRKVADMVHEYGAKIFDQISHGGLAAANKTVGLPRVSCSQFPMAAQYAIPKELEIEEIKEIQKGFAKTARNLKEAGFDGIQLHAGHGYLIQEFLTPVTNKRTDEYGGSLDNRMRFLLEIVDLVRKEIGDGMALGARILADELTNGGLDSEDMKKVAQKLEATGKIDYLDVDLGTMSQYDLMLASVLMPPGPATDSIAKIKEAVKIPILGTPIRLADPIGAEKVLADGKMDMVGITRGQIADPEFANKAHQGKIDDIRACLFCNEKCVAYIYTGLPIRCNINPNVGREKTMGIGTLKQAPVRKKVMVIGGGPAGMEVALVTTLRGHDVTIYEKDNDLGGAFKLHCKLPNMSEMESIIRWYKMQLKNLGVKIILGKEVTKQLVDETKPDTVVVATGANFLRNGLMGSIGEPLAGWDQKNVVTPEQIIMNEAEIGNKIVILDDESHTTGVGVAELLADQGKTVEIVTKNPFVGMDLGTIMMLKPVYESLLTKGVKFRPFSIIPYIPDLPGAVTVLNPFSMQTEDIEAVDTIVMVTAKQSRNELYKQLKGKVKELYAVGDCVSPSILGDAIYMASKVGRSI